MKYFAEGAYHALESGTVWFSGAPLRNRLRLTVGDTLVVLVAGYIAGDYDILSSTLPPKPMYTVDFDEYYDEPDERLLLLCKS